MVNGYYFLFRQRYDEDIYHFDIFREEDSVLVGTAVVNLLEIIIRIQIMKEDTDPEDTEQKLGEAIFEEAKKLKKVFFKYYS